MALLGPDRNILLAQLSSADYDLCVSMLQCRQLSLNEVLHDGGEKIRHVYFPIDAVIAKFQTCVCGDEHSLYKVSEAGMVGMAAIGDGISAWKAKVEKPGLAYYMSLEVFQDAIESAISFRQMVVQETLTRTEQFMRQAAMNEWHHSQAIKH